MQRVSDGLWAIKQRWWEPVINNTSWTVVANNIKKNSQI